MKFLKSLFKSSKQAAQPENVAVTGTLPPIDLTRTTRPIMSQGDGSKNPRVGKLTLYMLMSDM